MAKSSVVGVSDTLPEVKDTKLIRLVHKAVYLLKLYKYLVYRKVLDDRPLACYRNVDLITVPNFVFTAILSGTWSKGSIITFYHGSTNIILSWVRG